MHKQIFFLLSSMIVCMPIVGMEQESQEKGLVGLPPEILYKITPRCDLQSIGRLKQVNKQFSEYDSAHMTCLSHGCSNHVCSSIAISKLAKKESYDQCSYLLTHCINDENIFGLLYSLHENERDEELKNIYATIPQSVTMRDRILGYSGRYSDGDLIQACIDLEEEYQTVLSKEVLVEKAKKNQLKLFFKRACVTGNVALVKLFIEQGVNINAFDPWDGYIPTEYALQQMNAILLYRLYEYSHKRRSPLHCACIDGKLDLAKLLIKNGASVNVADQYGLLHQVCEDANVEISKLLIENGANIYAIDINDISPLNIMQSKPEFKELVDSLPSLGRNTRLIRHTAASLLVLGVGGIISHYFFTKLSNG